MVRGGDITYKAGLSMIILLPKKGQSLQETSRLLYSYTLQKVYRELYIASKEYPDDDVEVYIPKFEVNTDLDLKPILQKV